MVEYGSNRESRLLHRPRVTFYVQHLLGIGHLARAFRIAKALAEDAFVVEVVVGGLLPAGIEAGRASIVQLPPIRAGEGGFTSLVHANGDAFDTSSQESRRDLLLGHVDRFAPDILVIEAFPFGRRQMRFELIPLLEAMRARDKPPLVVASVRDILQEHRSPERVAETLSIVDRFFDLVLVHGDPRLFPLEESFPAARHFGDKIVYTGLVAPPSPKRRAARFGAVVSVGGGAVGGALLTIALAARDLTAPASLPWLFLTGPNLPDAIHRQIERDAADGSVVTAFVPDLAQVLAEAALSISQAGYNTVADILAAECRSVLIPYAAHGETEQTHRATVLHRRRRAVMVNEEGLTPTVLADAVSRALEQDWRDQPIDLQGAANTVRVLREALQTR